MTFLASPMFIARLGGLPLGDVERLVHSETVNALGLYLQAEAALASGRSVAADRLYEFVGRAPTPESRNAAIRVRRDLHNARVPRDRDARMLSDLPETKEIMSSFIELQARVTEVRSRLVAEYPTALAASRASLRDSLQNDRLRDGLALSSPDLFRNLQRYHRASLGTMGSRDQQIERGVVRYMTRASAKATPFAAFCTILRGEIVPDGGGLGEVVVEGTLGPRRNLVRLNKAIYGAIWPWLKTLPVVRDRLLVQANPTIDRAGEEIVFLASSGVREAFRRLDSNEVVDLILAKVNGVSDATYADLLRLLIQDPQVEATPEEARVFLDRLVDMGLIHVRGAVKAKESDWVPDVLRLLEGIGDDRVVSIREFLRLAHHIAEEYPQRSADERHGLQERLVAALSTAFQAANLPAFKILSLPLYEDCGSLAKAAIEATPRARQSLQRLASLVERLVAIAGTRGEMMTMRAFFDRFYPDRVEVPMLTFYEDYYREHFRRHLELQHRRKIDAADPEVAGYNFENPFGLESIRLMFAANRRWTEAVRRAWNENPDAVEVNVDSAQVLPVGPDLAEIRGPCSVAIFCQFIPEGQCEAPRIVTTSGRAFLGFGKYFSRFLDVIGTDAAQDLQSLNRTRYQTILAEIGGDSNFNANLHPDIVDAQIEYPGADLDATMEGIRCADLMVRRADHLFGLTIRHAKSGATVTPLDLGFLTPIQRPPLYQLLMRLGPFGAHSVMLPLRADARTEYERVESLVYRPRILVDDTVVLSRRSWVVPDSLFPAPSAGEADVDYFARINIWRNRIGIPDRVYVRVLSRPSKAAATSSTPTPPQAQPDGEPDELHAEEEAEAPSSPVDVALPAVRSGERPAVQRVVRRSRDHAKPQFIDFRSPLLVQLFGRLPRPMTDFVMQIEEQYPDADHSPRIEDRPHACELILQFDSITTDSHVSRRGPA